MNTEQTDSVYAVTGRIIQILEQAQDTGNSAAPVLAALRNSAGSPLSEAADVWPFLFQHLPGSFLSSNGSPTFKETAVFSTLQMYAIIKQGSAQNIVSDMTYRGNIGSTLRKCRETSDSTAAMDRRFNAMITADSVEEFLHYLRQIIKIMKSTAGLKINFARLAEDIYRYQAGGRRKVCFSWAQEYYSTGSVHGDQDKGEEKQDV